MPSPTPHVDEETVLERCEAFIRFGFWGGPNRPQPERWLSNFNGKDRELALYLLSSFQYLSEDLCVRMFRRVWKLLALEFSRNAPSVSEGTASWEKFSKEVIVSHVPGEHPNSTDSGHHYARWARQILKIPEDRIVEPNSALEFALQGIPILFLDDFVGSGEQFITLWKSDLEIKYSFSQAVHEAPKVQVFYCPLVATTYGLGNIKRDSHEAIVIPVHELDKTYNVMDLNAGVWPPDLQADGVKMVQEHSTDLRVSSTGFHGLSLALGFFNSIPDATLPLFFHDSPRWKCLVTRS